MSFFVIIRNTTQDDYLTVKRFFLDNQSKYNLARSDQVLYERIGRSKFIIITERNLGIVGVSGTFEYGADAEFREAGATRIVLNGFRFQRVLHYARSLHEFILDFSYTNYFATVVDGNTKSIENLEYVGFEKWDPPNLDLVAEKSTDNVKYLSHICGGVGGPESG